MVEREGLQQPDEMPGRGLPLCQRNVLVRSPPSDAWCSRVPGVSAPAGRSLGLLSKVQAVMQEQWSGSYG